MKKLLCSVLVVLCAIPLLHAQQIHEGDLILTTQAAIDTFQYTQVNGTLTIEEATEGEISNLLGLSTLIDVENRLIIQNNAALVNLDGLQNLLDISTNNTPYPDGQLWIQNNALLSNLFGLQGLTEIDMLWIENNPMLTDISVLSNTSIESGVNILNNDSLQTLEGVYTTSASIFLIHDNDALQQIDALSTMDAGTPPFLYLSITGNTALKNLDGLQNMPAPIYNFSTSITLYGNLSLTDACGIATLLSTENELVYEKIYIADNAPNTSTADDILANCKDCEGIYEGNLTLTSQDQINDFAFCEVTGHLTIDEAVSGNITDLSPLSTLETLGGGLYIKNNTAITNLDGLHKVTTINGSLQLYKNANLSDITALSQVQVITGNLAIQYNNDLASLAAFSGLETLQGAMNIHWNSSLLTLDGFENLTQIGSFVEIKGNANMASISGLTALTYIAGDLRIINNALTDVSGLAALQSVQSLVLNTTDLTTLNTLSGLTEIRGSLYLYNNNNLSNISGLSNVISSELAVIHITGNAALDHLAGLENIGTVSGEVKIENNQDLLNVDALLGLTTVGGDLVVTDNTALTNACGIVQLLDDPNAVGGSILIENNDYYTSSIQDITDRCRVFQGDIILTTQAEVDAFDYTFVYGNLTVEEEVTGGITNLDALEDLIQVNGDMIIKNNEAIDYTHSFASLIEITGIMIFYETNLPFEGSTDPDEMDWRAYLTCIVVKTIEFTINGQVSFYKRDTWRCKDREGLNPFKRRGSDDDSKSYWVATNGSEASIILYPTVTDGKSVTLVDTSADDGQTWNIYIYDFSGRRVDSGRIESSQGTYTIVFDTPLSSGAYFIKIQSNQTNTTKRFIVK